VIQVPLLPLILAAGACLVASISFAGDLAATELSAARLAALSDPTRPNHAPFARLRVQGSQIHSRWLVVRVASLCSAAAWLSDMALELGAGRAHAVIAVAATVLLYGALAEIFATIAQRRPERMILLSLRWLRPLELLAVPIAAPLALLGHAIGGRVPEARSVDARITETEVEAALSAGERTGAISEEPAEMIRNVLDFKDLSVREVMVPRRRVAALELSTSLATVLQTVATDGHSRYPVYRETLDNVVGLVYVKDLFVHAECPAPNATLMDLVRKDVLMVVEYQSALSVLREMRSRRLHMAIVADEFGGTEGIVTLEDILEEIVGEIDDEYDTDAPIHDLGEGRFLADAAVAIADLEDRLGKSIRTEGDFESLGGLIVHRAGKVPTVGESVTLEGLHFVVREADETHVIRVEITPIQRPRLSSSGEQVRS
jgi:putative hemolysin